MTLILTSIDSTFRLKSVSQNEFTTKDMSTVYTFDSKCKAFSQWLSSNEGFFPHGFGSRW